MSAPGVEYGDKALEIATIERVMRDAKAWSEQVALLTERREHLTDQLNRCNQDLEMALTMRNAAAKILENASRKTDEYQDASPAPSAALSPTWVHGHD